MYARYGKRVMDVFLSLIAIVLLAIPMLGIAIAVKLDDPKGHVIFKQTRIGRHGRKFKIYKFRSMDSSTPKHLPSNSMSAAEYEKHVTKIGKFLRRTSLDEIPQVFNILRGDMSWVGPRPVLERETSLTESRNAAGLHAFRPGLTGWAQINGRNLLTDAEKARYDAEYVEKISMVFDLCCMMQTFVIVISKKGFLEGSNQAEGEEFPIHYSTTSEESFPIHYTQTSEAVHHMNAELSSAGKK